MRDRNKRRDQGRPPKGTVPFRNPILAACLWASCFVATVGPSFADGAGTALMPSGAAFQLEVVSEPQSLQRGYMYRDNVGSREGMLFVFGRRARHGIWMKNCRVSLDLLWLDRDYRIVEIVPEQPPCPADGPCPTTVPLREAWYVLELAAGAVAEQELKLGDRLQIVTDVAPP